MGIKATYNFFIELKGVFQTVNLGRKKKFGLSNVFLSRQRIHKNVIY